jgi:hypothetical protein
VFDKKEKNSNVLGDDNVWAVVKSFKQNPSKGYRLMEGDYIKLGRMRFRIKEFKSSKMVE